MINSSKALPRMAAIHDISGFGKCSLTVALPVVSASGVECAVIPTALLSTHTGGFKNWTFNDLSGDIVPIAQHWHDTGIEFDSIYSGYLASEAQGELLEKAIDLLKGEHTLVIVDPAMADNGKYYANLGEGMAECFKKLIRKADVITPNITEACFLTGTEYKSAPHTMDFVNALLNKLSELGPRIIAITGISLEKGKIGVVARDNASGKTGCFMSEAKNGMFHGSGDVFASALAALLTKGVEVTTAIQTAEDFVSACIDKTAERADCPNYGLDFELCLPEYIKIISEL